MLETDLFVLFNVVAGFFCSVLPWCVAHVVPGESGPQTASSLSVSLAGLT